MPIIYLRHFIHGTKVATLELEALADEENGWVRYNPEEPAADPEPVNELKRRGRPRKEPQEV